MLEHLKSLFKKMPKQLEEKVEKAEGEIVRVARYAAVKKAGDKFVLIFSPSRWSTRFTPEGSAPWIQQKRFKSMTALKRWCRDHHQVKFASAKVVAA